MDSTVLLASVLENVVYPRMSELDIPNAGIANEIGKDGTLLMKGYSDVPCDVPQTTLEKAYVILEPEQLWHRLWSTELNK